MSDKRKEEQERFSIEDIIAEVKAEKEGKVPPVKPAAPKAEPAPTAPAPQPEDTPEAASKPRFNIIEAELGAPRAEPSAGMPASDKPEEPDLLLPRRPLKRDSGREKTEPAGDPSAAAAPEGDEVLGEDKAPGRRVILFKSRRPAPPPPAGEAEETAEGAEGEAEEPAAPEGMAPYPVSDDDEEYYIEEDYEEDEEEKVRESIPYDFLNVPFDDPTRAVKRLGRKLVNMSMRLVFLTLLAAGSGYLTFAGLLGLPELPVLADLQPEVLKNGLLTLAVLLALLCSWEVTTAGLWRMGRLRPTMDSLVVCAALPTLIHSLCITLGVVPSEQRSLAFIAVLTCFFGLVGKRSRARTLRRTYKCMEITADPTAVKAVGGKKYRAAVKTHERAYAEAEEVAVPDLAEQTSCLYAPVAIVASFALAAAASLGKGDSARFFHAWSAISSMLCPAALCIASCYPWARVARKLFTSGAAILHPRAARTLSKVRHAALFDGDIFPVGSVYIAGMKITSSTIKMEQVLADAAAVMKEVGGGIGKAFGDLAREQYLVPRRAVQLQYYDGGISARVSGDSVLIGTAPFLQRMGVMVHEGTDKKEAVFVSVNSYMAAIFTLKYTVQPQPYAAFGILSRCRIMADLALKDFCVTERLVNDRFALKKGRANIPEQKLREAYWQDDLSLEAPVCAIMSRDSALAFAEVLGGAKVLIRTVRLNLFCAYACSLIGLLTMYFLAVMDKIYLASPENIALYLLIWLLPVWFSSIFMTRY